MGKQREEFEKWYFNGNYKDTTACKLKVFEVLGGLVGVESPYNGTYLNYNVQTSWKAWQQAQKVAVPDGFVVVPREPGAELVNHGHKVFLRHFNEGGQTGGISLYYAYKAMIKAQEN